MSTQLEASTPLVPLKKSPLWQWTPQGNTSFWIAGWLIIGIGLRFWYWTANFSIWHDEAALLINVLDLSYREMFGTLKLHLPAPPLFLVMERGVYQLFGDHQLALRFVPWAASCLALIFFADLSQRVLDRRGAVWAVAFLAVSDRVLWHAQEAKTYSTDLLLAVVTLWLWIQTRENTIVRRSIVGMLLFPWGQWLSFPLCFLAGMWLIGMVPDLLTSRRSRDGLGFLLLTISVGGSFLALLFGPIAAQRSAEMDSCWIHQFPNWQKPLQVPFWCVTQTLELLRYLLMPTGQLLAGVTLVGAIRLIWRKDFRLLNVCCLPVILGCVAALLMKYPYGGARVCLFMMPGLLLLMGLGIPPTLDWAKRQSPVLLLVGWLILGIPFGYTFYRLFNPWPREEHASACYYITQNTYKDEMICSAHWETQYYLRHYPSRRDGLPHPDSESPDSFWFLTTMNPNQIQEISQRYSRQYHRVDEKTFSTVHVIRFQRRPVPDPTTTGIPKRSLSSTHTESNKE